MSEISITAELKILCPILRLGCIQANVSVAASGEGLLTEIKEQMEIIQKKLIIEDISKISAIEASRNAYKACGKDPTRYRLSAEALLRRVVSEKELYQINNVVDQLNLVSVISGFSIGGYDTDKIQGNIEFGIGIADEPYMGIGKGNLNIENLPVFRDQLGAFGTPTSDSQRTEVNTDTVNFLMILIDFGRSDEMETSKIMAVRLLKEYCHATNIKVYNIG